MMTLQEKVRHDKSYYNYPEQNMDVWAKFHRKPPNSYTV